MKNIILIASMLTASLTSQAHRVNNGFIAMTTIASCHQDIPPNMLIYPVHEATLYKFGSDYILLSVTEIGENERRLVNQYMIIQDEIKPLIPSLFLQSEDGTIQFTTSMLAAENNQAQLTIPFEPYKIDFKCTLNP